MKISENNYVQLMQCGDEGALQYFIEHHGWIVKSLIQKSMAGCVDEQEDCMNEIFLTIWLNVGKYDRHRASFLTWAAAVTHYQILNYMRNMRRNISVERIEGMEIIGDTDIKTDIFGEIEKQEFSELLQILSAQDRKVFVELFWEEKSYEEVSEKMEVKKDVLYNRVSRAKRKLRKALENKKGERKNEGYL